MSENAATSTSVGSLTATDTDGDTITYSITGGNTDIDGDGKTAVAINASTGAITVNDTGDFDFEGVKTFNLTVQASDGSLSSTATATINLTDVNESPKFLMTSTAQGLTLDALQKQFISTTDALIPMSGDFSISVDAKLDEIDQRYYEIVSQGKSGTNGFYIGFLDNQLRLGDSWQVTNVEKPADDSWHSYQLSKVGNRAYFYLDGELLAETDSFRNPDPLDTFAIGKQFENIELDGEYWNGSINNVKIFSKGLGQNELNQVRQGNNLSSQTISFAFKDGGTVTAISEFTKGGSWVGGLSAKDPEGDTVSYSITDGNLDVDGDGNLAFAINSSNGAITVNDASDLDFGKTNSFDLTVKASDGASSSTTISTVKLTNINEAPTLAGKAFSLAENMSANASVGSLSSSDPDSDTLSYSITGGNTDVDGDGSAAFKINAFTGAITVNDVGDLDFEKIKSFNLTVGASDGSLSSTATATINLTNVNEAPTLRTSAGTIAENLGEDQPAGTGVIGGDPEGNSITYRIVGGNTDVDGDGKAAFKINASTAAITVNDSGDLNYELIKTFSLSVQASDGSLSSKATVAVKLSNVDEDPTGAVTISGTATEGSKLTAVSTLKDPDGEATAPAQVQWLRDGAAITGATSSTYLLTATDVGKAIRVRVSYTDGGGFAESVSSSAVTPTAATRNPGVTVSGTDKTTGENGDTAVFSVRLNAAPVKEAVTVRFAVSDATEAKLSATSLTFTKANWNIGQTLTVTGVDDDANDGDVSYNLTASIDTNELTYKRVTVSPIALTNKDDGKDKPILKEGSSGIDYLVGGNGDDRLYGMGNMDDLSGGRGNDRLYGGDDDDLLYGEDGNDWLYGGYDDDKLYGGSDDDELYGEAGADLLEGGTGNDYLDGGTGADTMIGGAGNDTYFVDNARDVIDDQGGLTDEDTVIVMATITYKLAANVENAELRDGSGAASLTGNSLNNDLTGNGSANSLDGGNGSDMLDGGAGKDTLVGGDGADILIGGLGNDSLNGGSGDDLVNYSDAAGEVTVNLTSGRSSGDGIDTLASIEDVIGSEGDDIIIGSAVGNELTGGLGADQVSLGADKAVDWLLYRAVVESTAAERDRISQFVSQQDKISVSGIDANSKLAGDQAFQFSGTTAKANALWYGQADVDGDKQADDLIVYADVNGDGKADFEVGLVGVVKLVQTDFVL